MNRPRRRFLSLKNFMHTQFCYIISAFQEICSLICKKFVTDINLLQFYRCGFAQSQQAYDVAVRGLFDTLDKLESHLSTSRYLCGDALTLADVCLFTTLIRFDLAYNVLFKCTKKKLVEYPNLYGYLCDIYQIPGVAKTCNFEAIMDGYFCTLFPLNPGGIRPALPLACDHEFLSKPHNRQVSSSKGVHISES